MTSPELPRLDQMRRNYTRAGLLEKDVHADPVVQFQRWFADALAADTPEWFEVNAMTLSTADAAAGVTSRIVLLKGVSSGRFLFFTSYDSVKGKQMEANEQVSLCFFWPHLQRQVRVQGNVSKVARAESEAYFHSRPRDSQLGAHVSEQSQPLTSKEVLEATMQRLQQQYPEGTVIPLPEHWGGYAVEPTFFEFWQGRPSRLHDRIVYQREAGQWKIGRLAP